MSNIVQRNYYSTNDFVRGNKLEKEAVQLFGKDWQAESDIEQIESLLKLVGAEFFQVTYEEGKEYDLKVSFNSDLKRIDELEKLIAQSPKMLGLLLQIQDGLNDKSNLTIWEQSLKLECDTILKEIL